MSSRRREILGGEVLALPSGFSVWGSYSDREKSDEFRIGTPESDPVGAGVSTLATTERNSTPNLKTSANPPPSPRLNAQGDP